VDLPPVLPFHLQVSVVITTTSKLTLDFELKDELGVDGLSPPSLSRNKRLILDSC
jgi:hypothetical protein